jgi:hypothetical protein
MPTAARPPITGPATQALLAEVFGIAGVWGFAGTGDEVGEGVGVVEGPGVGVVVGSGDVVGVVVGDGVSVEVGSTSKTNSAVRPTHPYQCLAFASTVFDVKTVSALHLSVQVLELPSRK